MQNKRKIPCGFCGAVCETMHKDHIIPHSRGGGDDARNCLVSCPACNLAKHDRTPSEWRPSGLPAWVYEVEETNALRYRMKARKRASESRTPIEWVRDILRDIEEAPRKTAEAYLARLPPRRDRIPCCATRQLYWPVQATEAASFEFCRLPEGHEGPHLATPDFMVRYAAGDLVEGPPLVDWHWEERDILQPSEYGNDALDEVIAALRKTRHAQQLRA